MIYLIVDLLNPKDILAFKSKVNADQALSNLQDDVDADHKWELISVEPI
jgi:hypothetical protein